MNPKNYDKVKQLAQQILDICDGSEETGVEMASDNDGDEQEAPAAKPAMSGRATFDMISAKAKR